MNITRDNYEIWFLDYLEGRLGEEEKEEVRQFLVRYPDLVEEIEAFAPALASDTAIVYPDKSVLKKEIYDDPELFENTAVASIEGDLEGEELLSFQKWLTSNPDKQEFIQQLEKTRLTPDLSIGFPSKKSLKKKVVLIPVWLRVAAAAAMFLLAYLILEPERTNQKPEIQMSAGTTGTDQAGPSKKNNVAVAKDVPVRLQKLPVQKIKIASSGHKITKTKIPDLILAESRQPDPILPLVARFNPLSSNQPAGPDLATITRPETATLASSEIALSDYLENKLQAIKASGPKGFFSREEFAVAGLHLFARLPGHRLTGRKGDDGRLKSISFNTQLLAVSIPVNREL